MFLTSYWLLSQLFEFLWFLEVQGKGKWLGPLLMPDSSPAVWSKLTKVGTVLRRADWEGASRVTCHCLPNLVLSFPKYKLSLAQTVSVFQADRFACDQTQGRWSCENLRNAISLILKSEGEGIMNRPRSG